MKSSSLSPRTRRRLRTASPILVAGAVGLAAWVPSLSAGASTPDLPPITATQLIAKISQAKVTALQGTVELSTNLGLPSLSELTGNGGQQVASSSGFDPTTLLSGTHAIEVWTDGDRQRLALPSTMAETDLVRSGNQAWLYDSGTQHVTHYVVDTPARSSGATSGSGSMSATAVGAAEGSGGVPLTPQQAAAKLLAHVTPSTLVSAAAGPDVAGQHAYLLTLSPKPGTIQAAQSTISQVTIAVDAANGLPLEVAIYTVGISAPALQLGFSSVSFSTPSASNFAAPIGTSTTTKVIHGGQPRSGAAKPKSANSTTVTGPAWAEIFTLSDSKLADSREIDSLTTPVTGKFGTARLLQTNVVNALVLPDGKIVVGFVTPAALEASDAAWTAGTGWSGYPPSTTTSG